jgi:hypothetical protein
VIFFSIGLPGRFSEWCERVIARLADTLMGPVVVGEWPSLDEMLGYRPLGRVLDQVAVILLQNAPAHLVINVRQPDERLHAALAETAIPFVLALDDPRVAVADILAKTDFEPAAATRVVADSCSFVMRYTAMPGAFRLHANEARGDASGIVSAIARHLRIPIGETEAAAIADSVAQTGSAPGETASGAGTLAVADWVRKMLDGALGPYGELFAGGILGHIVWTRDLFWCVDDPRKKPAQLIDVSGGARCLIYGPYIHLPPGSWSARVVLGFSREAAGYIFLVDACCADRQLAAVSFQPDAAGIRVTDISFTLGEAACRGVEIRVMVLSEMAKGQLAFGHVVLTPLVLPRFDAETQSQDDLEAVLDL